VRKTPRINGEVVGMLLHGACIEVSARHGKWVQHNKGGWSLSEDAGDVLVQRQSSKCPECGREFMSSRALGGHMKIHKVAGIERKKKSSRKAKHLSSENVKPRDPKHKRRQPYQKNEQPCPGQRVRVRFRNGAKYLGTVIEVRLKKRATSIKIRYDDGEMEDADLPDPDIEFL